MTAHLSLKYFKQLLTIGMRKLFDGMTLSMAVWDLSLDVIECNILPENCADYLV